MRKRILVTEHLFSRGYDIYDSLIKDTYHSH
jgi:hypothetical protein